MWAALADENVRWLSEGVGLSIGSLIEWMKDEDDDVKAQTVKIIFVSKKILTTK